MFRELGAYTPSGSVRLATPSGEMVYVLYRVAPLAGTLKRGFAPTATPDDFEGPDNLRRREDWFRRRGGDPE